MLGRLGKSPSQLSCRHFPCVFFIQDRAGTNSPLDFEVVGGAEVGQPIFIHKVVEKSVPEEAGLRVGDQVHSYVCSWGSMVSMGV